MLVAYFEIGYLQFQQVPPHHRHFSSFMTRFFIKSSVFLPIPPFHFCLQTCWHDGVIMPRIKIYVCEMLFFEFQSHRISIVHTILWDQLTEWRNEGMTEWYRFAFVLSFYVTWTTMRSLRFSYRWFGVFNFMPRSSFHFFV